MTNRRTESFVLLNISNNCNRKHVEMSLEGIQEYLDQIFETLFGHMNINIAYVEKTGCNTDDIVVSFDLNEDEKDTKDEVASVIQQSIIEIMFIQMSSLITALTAEGN